jgi:pSer/pThr/pTyr-binding forkhead associated (FHA) protein
MASKSFKLQQGRQCTVGREPLHDISLGNHQVSRNHARLTLVAGGVELTDLGSANGTFVGEQKRRLEPDQPRVVAFGDVFWIGPEIKLCVEQ